jgi:hypothetical protein
VQNPTSVVRQQITAIALPVADLGLPARARNVLLGAGLNYVGDVLAALEQGDEALTGLKGFGSGSLATLKERLRERGIPLPGEAPPTADVAQAVAVEDEEKAAPEEAALDEEVPEEAPDATEGVASDVETAGGFSSFLERLQSTLVQAREQISLGAWVPAVIGVLLVVVALLPPLSLLERLGLVGFTAVDAKDNYVEYENLMLSVDPATFSGKLRVRLDSVPRDDFLGFARSSLREAVEALPGHLEVKSEFYRIRARGKADQPVMIDVAVPNNAEPWETLDLYTWTGEAWEWVGGELHAEMAEHEFVRARVTEIPANLIVVQAGTITTTVSTSLEPGDNPVPAANVLDEINPVGLILGTDGGFVGDPGSLPQPAEGNSYAVVPVLRNWAPSATVNRGLLVDVLENTANCQDTHIANIVQLCSERGFAGVEVDYRGITPEDRDAYSGFISALADALHAEGLRLNVVVEAPTPANGVWDTGGYDWAVLGAAADAVKVPFPDDPAAYAEFGEAQRLLDWAKAQVGRYKLRMLVSSLSVDQGSGVRYVSLEEALASFGDVVATDGVTQVEPGGQVAFGFSGRILSITPQDAAGTYRLEYEAADGTTRTVWLGTAANLAAKLRWAQRYHLGGVAVADLVAPGNAEGLLEAVAGYRSGTSSPAGQGVEVIWKVASAEEAVVDQQTSPLTAPGYNWTVLVTTGTYTVGATIAGFDRGSTPIAVGAPEPAAEEMVAEAMAGGAALSAMEVSDPSLSASYVADVTIPDNTKLDNEESFVKTWRVSNSGTSPWPEDTVIAFFEGNKMGALDSVPVGTLEPGAEKEVSVEMVAPVEAGYYTGIWRMRIAEGFFGGKLSVVIQAGEPTTPPPVAPISGGAFELGGHVRDMGLPHGNRMHYAGMNWAKVQVHYGQDASGIVAGSHANGFKVQLSALGSPGMVTQPGFEQDFANWVAGLAAAGADAIEVWNEPNIDREWQIGHISPQAYTTLLCAAYRAIKAANPNVAVISAAPSPTGFFGGCSPNGCDDAPWMAGLRDAGAAQCMDYIGAHHNAGATSPSARIGHPANPGDPHHSWFFLPQTELYYSTFGGARKLFYTEMGYASQEGVAPFSDMFGWARGTNNAQQAAWLAEAVQLSVNTGMVRCIIVWNIDFVRYGADPQDGYAIVRPDGSCPACESLHNLLGTR